jgi:hypothetical protein
MVFHPHDYNGFSEARAITPTDPIQRVTRRAKLNTNVTDDLKQAQETF